MAEATQRQVAPPGLDLLLVKNFSFSIGHQLASFHQTAAHQPSSVLVLTSVTLTFTFTLNALSFNWGLTNLKPNWASTLQLALFQMTAKAHQSAVSSCICHFLTTKPLFFIMANQVLWAFKHHPLACSHAWPLVNWDPNHHPHLPFQHKWHSWANANLPSSQSTDQHPRRISHRKKNCDIYHYCSNDNVDEDILNSWQV